MMNKENNNDLLKESRSSVREFNMAWEEYFKDKPKPKNDEEEKKELEEFRNWYNNVRKQSDTGKTPAEMYKEIYGKEPPKNPNEVNKVMNFEWDEDEINPFVRYCPECDDWGLEVTEDVNVYECNICGSVWKRLKPLNDGTGNMINLPKKLKKLIKEGKMNNEDEFWEEGGFIESLSSDEVEKKLKTLHEERDLNSNCKKCDKKISPHNKDWHDCMCDDCFNKTYFKGSD